MTECHDRKAVWLHQNIMISKCQSNQCVVTQEQERLVKELTEVLHQHQNIMISDYQSNHCLVIQEQEGLAKVALTITAL